MKYVFLSIQKGSKILLLFSSSWAPLIFTFFTVSKQTFSHTKWTKSAASNVSSQFPFKKAIFWDSQMKAGFSGNSDAAAMPDSTYFTSELPEKNAFIWESQNMAFLKGNWLLTLEAADLVHFVWGKVCLHFVLNARVTSLWPKMDI
jgi:hypothetical protein